MEVDNKIIIIFFVVVLSKVNLIQALRAGMVQSSCTSLYYVASSLMPRDRLHRHLGAATEAAEAPAAGRGGHAGALPGRRGGRRRRGGPGEGQGTGTGD